MAFSSVRRENVGWIDVLRILACFMVVFSHCCDGFVAQFDNNRASFLTGTLLGSLMRPSVPLFVMMTGVLLLSVGKQYTLRQFYKKRLGRIAIPLVFWSLLLPVLFYFYFANVSPQSANPVTDAAGYTVHSLLVKLYTFIFNFNTDTVPLWYLYMLIGLYLLMPILSCWLEQADKKDIKLVLNLWGVTLVLPYIKMFAPMLGYQGNYGNMELLGGCDWNVYHTFYYFSGFIGYLILAYYLKIYPLDWSWKKTLAITVPMFVVGYFITVYGYILTQNYYPGNYAYLEIVWYFSGINVFMMTFALFVIVQKIKCVSSPQLSAIARLTFGVYLCHYILVFVGYDLFNIYGLPYYLRIMLMSCFAFGLSLVWVRLMYTNPYTRRLVA